MISVSKKFKEAKRRDFYVTAQCTLSDNTILNLKREDFFISGNGIVDSSDSTDFPVGCAIEKTATLSLVNDDDRFSTYNFNAARFALTLNLDFDDGTSEKIRKGTFIVLKKPATAGRINMTLADRMYYADKTYTTNLVFPATAGEVLRDSCKTCGIQLGDATFPNDTFVISQKPENITHRAVIGYVAMIAGGNARIDESDRLRIIQFPSDVFADNVYDGGSFRPWTEGEELDGGTFDPWTTGTLIDGGTFADMDKYHVLYKIKGLQVDTDDVVVTGVKTTVDEVDYIYGSEGYVVKIENPLITGKEQEGVNLIGAQIVGLSMRPFSCDHIAEPTATFLDPAYVVDIKQNVYRSYITNIEFAFNGNTKISNTAKSAEEEAREQGSGVAAIVEQAKRNAEKSMSEYDIAYRNMNELAANTFGYYSTVVTQSDGSKITYWHDKPELSESKTVYKRGIDGFFVTQDYQGTDEATSLADKWKAGFDSNGDAVLNILYAIGIAAEWINTRGLTAKDNDGNITLRVDADTGKLQIVAKDEKGNVTFSVDSLTGAVTISPQAEVDGETLATKFEVVNGAITSEVTRAKGEEGSLGSRITQTDTAITSEVSRAKGAESSLSTRITQNADAIELTVKDSEFTGNNIISKINLSSTTATISASKVNINASDIRLQSTSLSWSSTYSSMTSAGVLKCSGADITGDFRCNLGQEFMEIKESVMRGGYGSTRDGLLDLSAQYTGGNRDVVLEAITYNLRLKANRSLIFEVDGISVDGYTGYTGTVTFANEKIKLAFHKGIMTTVSTA